MQTYRPTVFFENMQVYWDLTNRETDKLVQFACKSDIRQQVVLLFADKPIKY